MIEVSYQAYMFDETNTLVTATCIVNLHYYFSVYYGFIRYCSNMHLTNKGFINILTIIKTFATDSCNLYIIM